MIADGGHLSSPAPAWGRRPRWPAFAGIGGRRCRRGQAANPGTGRTPIVPLFGLAPGGVWPPARRRARPDALTVRFHPCRADGAAAGRCRRYVSVPLSVAAGLASRPANPWALPSTLSGGARTFLPETIAQCARAIRVVSRRPPGRSGILPLLKIAQLPREVKIVPSSIIRLESRQSRRKNNGFR